MNYRSLALRARTARKHARAPYSGFRVGAALLTVRGKVFTGCNIENSSFGLTVCAERTAIFKAVSDGEHSFSAIAIATDDPDFTPPCGACRQVLMDLAGDIDLVLARKDGRLKIVKLSELFPFPFTDSRVRKG